MTGLQRRLRVLFLCTANSCRSQMAEAWAHQLKGDVIEPYSAGTQPRGLDPRAIQVMAEVGVDLSAQRPKGLESLRDVAFDYVVTVCDAAKEACPTFSGKARVIHFSFDDPPRLAAHAASEAEVLTHYRRVRDEIRAFVERLPEALETLWRGHP